MRALLMALLLAGCDQAPDSCGNVMQPPVLLDHAPLTATIVREYPQDQVAFVCESLGTEPNRWACAKGSLIVLPAIGPNVTYRYQACLLHHEWGHENGWPANHAGGRKV